MVVEAGHSDRVPGRGSPTQGKQDAVHDWYRINETAAPTCQGNGLYDADVLCGAAVNTCASPDQVRFWIWHQRVDHLAGPPAKVVEGEWIQEPGTYCLGPDDPGVPNIVTTLAQAHNVFAEKISRLAVPAVSARPGPRTLVNFATTFRALNAEPFAFDVTVAGTTVHLAVHPSRFTWTFGDADTAETSDPVVTHTYLRNRQVAVRVDLEWSGTFTVAGQPGVYALNPPATATGAPTVLTVVTARAQLVQG